MDATKAYISLLQKHERGATKISFVDQGKEDENFWKMFNLDKPPSQDKTYERIGEWNHLLIDVSLCFNPILAWNCEGQREGKARGAEAARV